VGVGDDQLHATQAPTGQLAEEPGPDRLGLGGADLQAQHLAAPVGAHADGDDDRDRDGEGPARHRSEGYPERRRAGPRGWWRRSRGRASHPPGADPGTPSPCHRSPRRAGTPELLEMPDIPMALTRSSTGRVEMPWMRACLGSRRSAPSRPCAGARGRPGSSCPSAAGECAARRSRPASPSPGRDSRCAAHGGLGPPRHGRHRRGRRPPAPSAAQPQSRSSRARDRRQGSSRRSPAGSPSRRSSRVSPVWGGRRNQTLPTFLR